ncbi:hypothetical protein [Mycolicibacterium thermoresistibile]
MLSAIAIVPSAPVLVPELAGTGATELTGLRDAVFSAAATLPARWLAVGVGPADATVGADAVGTFAGYGVDVRVRLAPAPEPPHAEQTVAPLPLCALITGWVRGHTAPQARAEVRVCAAELPAPTALQRGRALRADIDRVDAPVGVLIVADGANTLTPSAPGGHRPEAAAAQQALDDALAAGDVAALTELPDTIVGRAAYHLLAGLTGARPCTAEEYYRGAPYGVGYFTGVWRP